MLYAFSVKKVRYGTPTGLNTMPASLTDLPDTVKGSIILDESDPTFQKFHTDQKKSPIRVVKTEDGETSAVMQFYDLTYETVAALKGGDATSTSWENPVDWEDNLDMALQIETDSGHLFNFYNAFTNAKVKGGGGRDSMFMLELKAIPQVAADGSGDWGYKDVPAE